MTKQPSSGNKNFNNLIPNVKFSNIRKGPPQPTLKIYHIPTTLLASHRHHQLICQPITEREIFVKHAETGAGSEKGKLKSRILIFAYITALNVMLVSVVCSSVLFYTDLKRRLL